MKKERSIGRHLSNPVVIGVRVAQSLVFCVGVWRSLFAIVSFGHCHSCPLIYGFWLPFILQMLSAIIYSHIRNGQDTIYNFFCTLFETNSNCLVWTKGLYFLVIAVLWSTASDYPFDSFRYILCNLFSVILFFWIFFKRCFERVKEEKKSFHV
jgi:hypothetical protein